MLLKILGETGIVAGWGRLSEGGQLPNILQYVSETNKKYYCHHSNDDPFTFRCKFQL